MSKWIIGALAIVVLASPSNIHAQDAPTTVQSGDGVQVKISKSQVAPAPYFLAPQEFSAYAQPYLLESGLVLMFEQRARRYYTQLRGEARVEIFPLAAGVFVSGNGTMFVFRDDGDRIAVSHLERLPFAGNQLISPDRVYASLR